MTMETPWQRARKTASQRQEERLGHMPGGSKQNNSGRLWRWRRDNKLWNFLVEARTTEAASYRVDGEEFRQIERDALVTPPGMYPAMQLDIRGQSLIVLRLADFQEMQMQMEVLRKEFEDENAEDED